MESEAKLIICNKFFFVHTHTYTHTARDDLLTYYYN